MTRPKTARVAEKRTREIAVIQIGRQQLAMEDAAYRAMLRRVSATHGDAVESSKDLSPRQRKAVMDELRRLGATGAAKFPGKPANFDQLPGEIEKIEALLADLKLPWKYADAIANRMFGIARVAWLKKQDHFTALIAALHVEQKKRDLGARIDEQLKRLGMTDADIEARWRLKRGWRRNIKSLCSVTHNLGMLVLNIEQPEPGEASA